MLHSYAYDAPAANVPLYPFVGSEGTNPPQSTCGSESVTSRVVSGSMPVLVTKTRHRAVGWLSVALPEVQSDPFIGWLRLHVAWSARTQIWSTAEIAAPVGGVADSTIAVPEEGVETTSGPEGGDPCAVIVCESVVGIGVTLVDWHTYAYLAPAAKLFPGTGAGPSQSVGEGPEFGRELFTVMLVSASGPVLVTTTLHQTSEPYHVAGEAQ